MENVKSSNSASGFWLGVLKGALTAFILSAIFVLVLALIAKMFALPTDVLPIVNQVLKAVAVIVAVALNVKGEKLFFKALLVATVYSLLSLLLFVILGGGFSFAQFATDWAIALAVSVITAVIKSKRRA